MKKAKVMLSAIAIFAVVGGALAFKAKTGALQVYQLNPGGQCHFVDIYDPLTTGAPITFENATIGQPTSDADCSVTLTVQLQP